MQPGYPGSGDDPYGQQQPYSDPTGQPQHPQYPQPPYQDPYAQPQPTSGNPYPTSPAYQAPGQFPAAPQYPVAGYGAPMQGPGQGQNNVLGILALVFGIASIPLAFCCGIGGLMGIAAGVMGFLGIKKANEGAASNKGMALAGLICGGVGVLITALWIAFYGFAVIGNSHTSY